MKLKQWNYQKRYKLVMKQLFKTLFLIILSFTMQAQSVLTLKEAIALGLKNNDNIAISKLNENIDNMQVYKANVGWTPRLDWNLNFNGSVNNVNQEFFDGRNINRFGRTISPNTNVTVNYPLYDGGRMKTQLQLLMEAGKRTNIMTKSIAEQVEDNIIITYFAISRQQATLTFLNSLIKYYQERQTITEQRWQIGRGSKLDYLQSQNDLNTQLAAIKGAEIEFKNLKIQLNLLINRAPDNQFEVEEFTQSIELYTFDASLKNAEDNSEDLAMIEQDLTINALRVKEIQLTNKPRIGVFSSLGYSLSNTNAGLILLNQNLGFNGGFTATWNLFDGGNIKKQTEISKYRSKILFKQRDLINQNIKSALSLAFNQWTSFKEMLLLEESNKKLAEENLTIAQEKFKLGASTVLEVNDAQQRYDSAVNRYLATLYNVKFAALDIERLSR